MNDHEIEALLQRYRPSTRLPELPAMRLPRTWPWAVAAAALLALLAGLHGSVVFSSSGDGERIDERRVQAIMDDLGGPQDRLMAEWIVREETRAARDRQLARTAPQPALGSQQ